MDILASKESQDVEEIVFNEDGSWTTVKSSVGCAGSSVDSPPVSSSNGHAPLAEASSIYPKANPVRINCGLYILKPKFFI